MKIIILGAGQVGGTLARNLATEDNDITLVDRDSALLLEISNQLDLQTISGHCAYPDVLQRAGIEDADLVIAVTNSDETNLIACHISHHLFHVPKKIARVRSTEYLRHSEDLFKKDVFPVDVVISPEKVVTDYIAKLISYPGALQVLDFADGLVQLVGLKAYYGGPLVGHAIAALKEHMPTIDTRVAAIFRRGRPIKPTGQTIIEADDEVFFLAATENIRSVMGELQRLENPYRQIVIAGGGHIGEGLAKSLESDYKVKLIERDPDRASGLSERLHHTVVLNGDASDRELLKEENIDQMDVFIAVTNNDAANIMSAMLAKHMGVRKTMVLINRTEYVDLIQGQEIDVAISPQQATTGSLLTHIRRGDVTTVYSLRKGAAEAIETIAHGDEQTSDVVGKAIGNVDLPAGTSIGAIVRNQQVLIAHDNIVIQSDDHVILFMVDKSVIRKVEDLFQVDATFI
jgi:trk system potassium uptake protein TrkA